MSRLDRPCIAVVAAVVVFIAATAGVSTDASAHDYDPEREVLVQVFDDHLDVMVVYIEAPGERTDWLRLRYGLAFGDELNELLEDFAGQALVPRVLDGLEFEVPGQQPRTDRPEVKLGGDDERLSVATYTRYELDEIGDDERRRVTVRTLEGTLDHNEVVIYGGDGVQAVELGDDDRPVPVELGPDDQHSVTFVRD